MLLMSRMLKKVRVRMPQPFAPKLLLVVETVLVFGLAITIPPIVNFLTTMLRIQENGGVVKYRFGQFL